MSRLILPPVDAETALEGDDYRTNFRRMRRRPVALAGDLQTPQARALLGWWFEAGAPPRRSAFDITEHADLAAHLFLMRRCAPGVFEYRLSGEEAIRIVGRNDRGDVFRIDDAGYPGRFAAYLEHVATGGRPWTCVGEVELADRPALIAFESLDCPLADDAGTVTWIIGVIEAVAAGERG